MLNTSQRSILFTGTSICNQLSNNLSNTTTSFTYNYKKLVLQTLSEQNSILIITLNHYYYQVLKNFFCYYCYFYHHYQYHYYNYVSIHHHFFSIWVFFHEHSRITGLQGKGEGIPLSPRDHFQLLHRHLDISRAITAESSPLHIASSRTRAEIANHSATRG